MMNAVYAFGARHQRPTSLLVAFALAGALIGGAWLPNGAARVAIVVPIMLFVPGHVLVRLAFGRRGNLPLARLVLSSVLSMSIVALLCVGLSAVSISLTRTSVALTAGVWITAVAALTVVLDARRATVDEATTPASRPRFEGRAILRGVGVAAAIAVAVGLAVAVRHLPPAPAREPFASLYLAGESSAVQQPISYAPGDPLSVTVGLANHSSSTHTYELTASINAHTIPYRTVRLAVGGTWQGTLSGVPVTDGCIDRLTISAVPLENDGQSSQSDKLSVGVWLQPLVERAAGCPPGRGVGGGSGS